MEKLRDESGETVILVSRGDGRLMVSAAVESRQLIRLAPAVGFVLPFEGSSAAAAIAAHLPPAERRRLQSEHPALGDRMLEEVRRRGWAANDEEVAEGVGAVAAAVLGVDGYPVAALAVCGPSSRVGRDDMPRLGPMVTDAARRVFLDPIVVPA